MEEIKKYLESESPDFQTGFALFCRYSRNQSLMSWIGRTKDIKMLIYNLNKIVNTGSVRENPLFSADITRFAPKMENISPPSNKTLEKNPYSIEDIISRYSKRYKREELPEELVPLYDKNVDAYKNLRALHEKMKLAPDDEKRDYFRAHLLALSESIAERWKLISSKADEFHTQKPKPEITAVQINSARAYISKMVSKENISDEQRLKVIDNYKLLIDNKATIKEETITKLKEKGFIS